MSLPNLPIGSVINSPVLTGDFYAPDDPSFGTSDCFSVSVSSTRIRFTRPVSDGQGYEHANPGARVRFKTASRRIDVVLGYSNLITRPDIYSGAGAVYANGSLVGTFDRGQGTAGDIYFSYDFLSTATREIEVAMPYCTSVDFKGLCVDPGAPVTEPGARPTTRYLAVGDSITHGFNASSDRLSWPTLLAAAKGWQLFNHGYGGRVVTSFDAADAVNGMPAAPDVTTYLIGFNNCAVQQAQAKFRATYSCFISNLPSAVPIGRLYRITPLWTSHYPGDGLITGGSLTIEMYRQTIREAVVAADDPLVFLIEGEPLATNSVTRCADGTHPNDVAASEIEGNLSPQVSA